MKIYFDTEFTDVHDSDFKLISAGFVAENGREFYFESPSNYQLEECSDFAVNQVIPNLGKLLSTNNLADHLPIKKSPVMDEYEASLKFRYFLLSFKEPVELCCDAPNYDWPALTKFLAKSKQPLAENLITKPKNVMSKRVYDKTNDYFETHPDAIMHHALCDARALAAALISR